MEEYELLLINNGKCGRQKVELWYTHRSEVMFLQLLMESEKECIVFTRYKTQWYNSSHVNKSVKVEHEEK